MREKWEREGEKERISFLQCEIYTLWKRNDSDVPQTTMLGL